MWRDLILAEAVSQLKELKWELQNVFVQSAKSINQNSKLDLSELKRRIISPNFVTMWDVMGLWDVAELNLGRSCLSMKRAHSKKQKINFLRSAGGSRHRLRLKMKNLKGDLDVRTFLFWKMVQLSWRRSRPYVTPSNVPLHPLQCPPSPPSMYPFTLWKDVPKWRPNMEKGLTF